MAQPVLTGAASDEMQGILRYGHGHLPEATFLLLRIADPSAARAWLAAAEVTSAAGPRPETALQLAFSHAGLRRLGLSEAALAGFSAEFAAGMAGDDNRSRRLGDLGANAPSGWLWGGDGAVDVLAMLYAGAGRLTPHAEAVQAAWGRAFEVIASLSTAPVQRNEAGLSAEPFGFSDGISQPTVDWDGTLKPEPIEPYRNLSALGEFVLGHPNEYGRYTDRPLLEPEADPGDLLPTALDDARKRDLGRGGCYLVLRDLQQDVAGFWRWLEEQAGVTRLTPKALAETMVGRRIDGTPLEPAAEQAILGVDTGDALNRFTYQVDPMGLRCPLGAHVRRANPRNPDMPGAAGGWLARLVGTLGFAPQGPREDLAAPTRFHRLLRRGRAYGGDGAAERGLRFVCLNANIARQFEFVQTAWIAGTKFGGVTGEADPLLGDRCPASGAATDAFSIPQPSGAPFRLNAMPQFVTVQGGSYFFLPSLPALRYLASLH
jgi:Dyp-type peroxidase family